MSFDEIRRFPSCTGVKLFLSEITRCDKDDFCCRAPRDDDMTDKTRKNKKDVFYC